MFSFSDCLEGRRSWYSSLYMLKFTGDHSTTLCISFVPFPISSLVNCSSLSVIIYQQEEGICLDGIVYSRIRTHGEQGPGRKPGMRSEYSTVMRPEYSAGMGPELRGRRGITGSVGDGELALYFLFKLPLPP